MNYVSKGLKMFLGAWLVWLLLISPIIAEADSSWSRSSAGFRQSQEQALVSQIQELTGAKATIQNHPFTGKVRFIGVNPTDAIRQPALLGPQATPEQAARGFLSTYGPLFGLTDHARELTVKRIRQADRGRSFVRFQQVYSGIPILGGELIVQSDGANNIVSANGEVLPGINLDATPTVPPEVAVEKALALVLKHYGSQYNIDLSSLGTSKPELWIYNPILLGVDQNMTRLVWRVEVFPTELLPIKELVLIDAQLGAIALHFNQIDTARNRLVYDHNNTVGKPLPGNPADLRRTEGGAATGIIDVDNAYDFSGDTYDFYWTNHGRDSINNAGMAIISTTRYCPSGSPCPYANAFWNGSQMVYGEGFASADDVVAHEITHGVTDYESGLLYYMQSGAINEAFSDIWGEFVDLVNGRGNDAPTVRWLMGEDLSIGAIRSMSNPPAYGDPDRMLSGNYYCGTGDQGGVHTNSGVGNKAAYLMTDGDTFNGVTVTGIGITKVAKIFYEVQANLMTSAGDYMDLYDLLRQACRNLIGTSGITSSNCQQVENAVNATEMNQQPAACAAKEAPVCTSGQAQNVFFDNLENTANGNWTRGFTTGSNQWYYPQNSHPYTGWDATYATSGVYNFWGYGIETVNDSHIRMTNNVTIPSGAYLHFKHAYNFEAPNYDGGVIEYSIGGGAWTDAGALILNNGYNGTIPTLYSNPLGGRNAFVGRSNGYISTRVNLATLSGQNVRFRFRIGTDTSGWAYGWFIDDIRIYTCVASTCSGFDFNEDFNDGIADNWANDGSGRWSVTGGYYRMTGNGAGTFRGSQYNADYCDFVYQAKVRKTAGTTTAPMGLFFRSNHPIPTSGSGYLFNIDTTGYYSLWKTTSGSETALVSWTSSASLNTGLNAWNILKVEARGSTIKIYANGTLLNTVSDPSYLSGKLGVTAYDQSAAPSSTVEYDFVTSDIIKRLPIVNFDVDSKTDIAAYHQSSGLWFIKPSSGAADYYVGYGGTGYLPVPGDYDGDGRTDIAAYHQSSGLWFIKPSSGAVDYYVGYGGSGYAPVPGDYDGDGRTDIAVYHQSSGLWFIRKSSDGLSYHIGYGGSGYKPIAGDFDGDGKTDIAVYHQASGLWFIRTSSNGLSYHIGYGGSGYVPVPGDYDGDGKTDIAVYHQSSGLWFIKPSSGAADYYVGYGGTGYAPIPEDFDGDGKTDIAAYHQSSGLWFIKPSSGAADYYVGYGGTGYIPVNLDYLYGYVY